MSIHDDILGLEKELVDLVDELDADEVMLRARRDSDEARPAGDVLQNLVVRLRRVRQELMRGTLK